VSSTRSRTAGGFTLLEVMCAFAILAMITSMITQTCHTAFEKGTRARDLRALREAADTVFRRLCYEDGLHTDGMRSSLDTFYAEWAELPSVERDRWEPYVLEFRRRPRTAAGEPGESGAEPLGDSDTGSGRGPTSTGTSGTGTSGTGTSGTGTSGSKSEDEATGVELMQLTLTIFHEDDPNEPLITLQTLLPPQGDGTTTGSKGTTTGVPK
jgi:prepilin-type N-terminal cleavage/methylation domain-containing protein